jgi:hypothetical protein
MSFEALPCLHIILNFYFPISSAILVNPFFTFLFRYLDATPYWSPIRDVNNASTSERITSLNVCTPDPPQISSPRRSRSHLELRSIWRESLTAFARVYLEHLITFRSTPNQHGIKCIHSPTHSQYTRKLEIKIARE